MKLQIFVFVLSFVLSQAVFAQGGYGPGNTLAQTVQLFECSFEGTTIDFQPSSTLTAMLKNDVKGAVVYKVKYNRGPFLVGPKTLLAVIDELPSKSLVVTFFDNDEKDGITYSENHVSIDLTSPISVEGPLIGFEANLDDKEATKGECSIKL